MAIPASANHPGDSVVIRRDACSILYEGWAPHELLAVTPSKGVLESVHDPFLVPARAAALVRASVAEVGFEALHRLFSPMREIPTARDHVFTTSSASIVCAESAQMAVVPSCHPRRTVDARATQSSGHDKGRDASAARSGDSFTFRLLVSHQSTRFTVERTPRHVMLLLDAVRYSFPHLLLPHPYDNEVTMQVVQDLAAFTLQHAAELCTYVPVLVFFFERNPALAVNFFLALEETLKRQICSEVALFDGLKAKVSRSWFWSSGAGTSKEVVPLSLSDVLTFMDENPSMLPSGFKDKYLFAVSRTEVSYETPLIACRLCDAATAELQALSAVAQALENNKLLCSAPFFDDDEGAVAYDCSSDTDAVSDGKLVQMVSQSVDRVSVLQQQLCLPLLAGLRSEAESAQLQEHSQLAYLEEMLECAITIKTKEPIVVGGALVKDSPAATNPAMLQQIRDLYERRCAELCGFNAYFEREYREATSTADRSRIECCRHFVSALQMLADGYDRRHHPDGFLASSFANAEAAPSTVSGGCAAFWDW